MSLTPVPVGSLEMAGLQCFVFLSLSLSGLTYGMEVEEVTT